MQMQGVSFIIFIPTLLRLYITSEKRDDSFPTNFLFLDRNRDILIYLAILFDNINDRCMYATIGYRRLVK